MNTIKEFLDKDIKFPITLDDVLVKIWVTIKEFLYKDIKFPINLDDVLVKIWVTINPKFWAILNTYNPILDAHILKGIQYSNIEFMFDRDGDVNMYDVKLDGIQLWIRNYPFGYLTTDSMNGRPSRTTIYKFKRKYDEEYAIHNTWKKL